MAAYLLAHRRKITGPETLKCYDNVEATIGKFGGKVLIRADEFSGARRQLAQGQPHG
jgi:uncharacterized protein (DUF1330 family)